MMPETSVASGDLVGADVGVVDRDDAAAVEPEVEGADGDDGDAAEHEGGTLEARTPPGRWEDGSLRDGRGRR